MNLSPYRTTEIIFNAPVDYVGYAIQSSLMDERSFFSMTEGPAFKGAMKGRSFKLKLSSSYSISSMYAPTLFGDIDDHPEGSKITIKMKPPYLLMVFGSILPLTILCLGDVSFLNRIFGASILFALMYFGLYMEAHDSKKAFKKLLTIDEYEN